MIVAVAGCPHPPLLLPGITGRPVAEVERLRVACLSAVGELLAAGPSRLVVVGGAGPEEDDKALSIVIARQLLRAAGCQLPVEHLVLAADSPTADCLQAGRTLAGSAPAGTLLTGTAAPGRLGDDAGIGLLVMGDGSARRSLKAPGYLDPRAAAFDETVQDCLASGRLAGLAELDPALAAELLVAGRAAWQVLAGAVGDCAGTGKLHYSDDPFGVWYPVFSWLPAN